MNKLKLVFFGTPNIAADFLEKMISDPQLPIEIVGVVTQPDKPVGRQQILTPSPVKIVAQKHNIPLWENIFTSPASAGQKNRNASDKNPRFVPPHGGIFPGSRIKSGMTFDLGLVYAFGEILSPEILRQAKYGFWNIHPSLLPKYRGASPIAFPLILGDRETGVTIIKMDDQLDHGPIIAQEKIKIIPDETREDLEKKLTDLSYQLFKTSLLKLILTDSTDPRLIQQDNSQATFTRQLKKDDGYIPFNILQDALHGKNTSWLPEIVKEYYDRVSGNRNASDNNSRFVPPHGGIFHGSRIKSGMTTRIYNYFRGLSPWPGLWTMIKLNNVNKRLKIIDMRIDNDHLLLTKVQLEGKKAVDFATFNQAYHVFK